MTTAREMIRSIQDSWEIETGERPSAITASVLLDQMCEAFYEKWMGAGHEYAVRQDPEVASYLVVAWKGEDHKALRAAIAKGGSRGMERVSGYQRSDDPSQVGA